MATAHANVKSPTKAQLKRFVSIRNASGFSSNLQFACDATEAGFSADDLGTPEKLGAGSYSWHTSHGRLVEHPGGQMEFVEQAPVRRVSVDALFANGGKFL